ncbi:phage tail protein [Cellulosimicrobium terreum]|nr:phage tail protein [Cellulosimicrobium terreum]
MSTGTGTDSRAGDRRSTGRVAVEGLASPHPVASMLPGVYLDDDLLGRFVTAFDDALAPVFLTLDTLECYVDPHLAPRDHLEWVGRWVGVELDPGWDLARCREVVADAARTQRLRGTSRGVADAVRAVAGGVVEVTDTGGVVASTTAGADLPGSGDPSGPSFHVRVRADDPGTIDEAHLRDVVTQSCPVHVPYTLEVVESR